MTDHEKRRVFYKTPTRIHTLHAFQFITSPRGVWRYYQNIGKVAGKNIFFLLNYMIERCSSETREGRNLGKKDVAQTHWMQNATIAEELLIDPKAVSEALTFLERNGLIVVKRESTKVRYFAASESFICAMKHFSACQDARDSEPAKKEPKSLLLAKYSNIDSPAGRNWLSGWSELTLRLVGIDSPAGRGEPPYIEEFSKETGKIDSQKWMDGGEDVACSSMNNRTKSQPAIVDVCKDIELSLKPDGFKPFEITRKFVQTIIDEWGREGLGNYLKFINANFAGHRWKKAAKWERILEETKAHWLAGITQTDPGPKSWEEDGWENPARGLDLPVH